VTTTTVQGAGGAGGTSNTTSSTTSGGTGGSGGGSSSLGIKCTADTDCGAGLICIKSSDNVSSDPASPGGYGNGYCTADCTADASVCGPLGGVCTIVDSLADGGIAKAVCFQTCTIGVNPNSTKCQGRQDVACQPVNADETLFACIPICVTDSDCGTRKCEAASGLCVDAPKTGKPVGAGCTVTKGATTDECEGFCLAIEGIPDGGTTAPGICTALCRLGTQEACGFRITPIDAGPPEGACVLPVGSGGYDTGDLGFCLQLCDSTADCGYMASDWICRTDMNFKGWGHSVCFVPKTD
jgi:hypothetical protein